MSEPAPMPSYWALVGEVTYLHGQLDKLQDENSKLRSLGKQCEKVLADYRSEVAKLREVLDSCAILLTDNQFPYLPELREATLKDMRELGIEVSE